MSAAPGRVAPRRSAAAANDPARELPFVYLASQSPRRRQLLDQIGVAHRPLLAEPDEDVESLEVALGRELPTAYVQRVTRLKLRAAVARRERRALPEAPILTADTTVVLGRRILGKPADPNEAAAILTLLSGRMHRVLTAVALHSAGRSWQAISVSRVRVAALSPSVIARYVASGEPFGKAGAYAIQGALAGWIEHVDGSHTGIMGLPLFETAQLLRRIGYRLPI